MKRHTVLILAAAVSVLLMAVAAGGAQKDLSDKFDQSLRKGESRSTLDPLMFREPDIRKAYEAAKEIPWVLDSIYCYCYCAESPAFRHKSLLSCYVDLHAAR